MNFFWKAIITLYYFDLLNIPLMINALFTWSGIDVEIDSEVHIDFKSNNEWYRYIAGNTTNAPIYYTTTLNRDNKATWIASQGTMGLTFENKEHSGYYLAIETSSNPKQVILSSNVANNIAEWKGQSTGTNGEDTMENQYATHGLCLHQVDGDKLVIESSCDRPFRIVPRWPCYESTSWGHIMAWYSGLSLDLDNLYWNNMMTNDDMMDITLTAGQLLAYFKGNDKVPGLYGEGVDEIIFPPQFATDVYTGIFLTHYSGNSRKRIIECKLSDCAVGHKDSTAGILYQDGNYLTATTGYSDVWKWVISTVKHGYYRANGYNVPTSGTPTHIVNDQFCINCDGNTGEYGQFHVMEVILINKSIPESNIQCIENYLVNRYSVSLSSWDPTPSPTNNPTEITNNPTPSPTDNPTHAPTDTTTNPSTDPTNEPTINPTDDPTNDPTKDPTNDPTDDPTFEPTLHPTINPTTSIPSKSPSTPTTKPPTIKDIGVPTKEASGSVSESPTMDPTTVATNVREELDVSDNDTIKNILLKYLIPYLALFLGIITILSFIYSKFIRKNDFYRFSAIITASLHVLDMISDVSLSFQISVHPQFISSISLLIIFIASLIFILLPLLLSLYQLYCVINREWSVSSNELRGWIHDNIKLLYVLSVLTGSAFTGIELCRSNLFNLTQFDIPISKTQLSSFKIQRIYSTIALENVPQILLQAWYIGVVGNTSGDIVYISMAFSIISIIIAVISMLAQKTIINTMDYVEIQFDVIGADITSNVNHCKNIINEQQFEIAAILGVNKNITEMARPIATPKGLTIKMKIYISISKAIDLNVEKLINNAKDSGELANIFKSSWSLKSTPIIENIKCKQIDSKIRSNNTVIINVTDVQLSKHINNNNDKIVLDGPDYTDNTTMHIIPAVVTDNGNNLNQTINNDSDLSSSSSISNYNGNITSKGPI